MRKPLLVDAQKMHKENPKTFEVHSKKELSVIRKGYFVKVCDNRERFWVIVTKRRGEKLWGVIDNQLIYGFGQLGEEINFEVKNIYSFMKGRTK
jgi:hypothetical protein